MSFSTTNTENLYTCDGSDSTFGVTFNYEADVEVAVEKIDYTDPDAPITTALTVNDTFTLAANVVTTVVTTDDGFGNPVYTPTPLSADHKIRIFRRTVDYHQAVYSTYQFPYNTVATDFDRVYQLIQELKRDLSRKIGLTPATTMAGTTLTGEEILAAIAIIEEMVEGVGGLPEDGQVGQYLEAGADSLGEWVNGAFQGYSSRFGIAIDEPNLRAAILKIYDFSYLGPQISLSGDISTAIREKGTVVSAVTLTANTTKRSDDITEVRFYRGVTLLSTDSSPSPDGSTDSSYVENTDFSDTTTFTAQVDDGTSTGNSNTLTYSFVYPYYYGSGAPGKTAAQVAALTKYVISSTASVNRAFTTSNGDVYYFAYPASYGALTSIEDENGFNTVSDWTLTTTNITGLDGNAVSYRIYEFNNTVLAGSTNYTFIR